MRPQGAARPPALKLAEHFLPQGGAQATPLHLGHEQSLGVVGVRCDQIELDVAFPVPLRPGRAPGTRLRTPSATERPTPDLMPVKHNVCRAQSDEEQRAAREIFRGPQELPGDVSGAYEPAPGQAEFREGNANAAHHCLRFSNLVAESEARSAEGPM